jgi:hypothetical protein
VVLIVEHFGLYHMDWQEVEDFAHSLPENWHET